MTSSFEEVTRLYKEKRLQVAEALKATKAIETAILHIEAQNYGLAKQWAREAQDHLPWDNGEHTVWPSAES